MEIYETPNAIVYDPVDAISASIPKPDVDFEVTPGTGWE